MVNRKWVILQFQLLLLYGTKFKCITTQITAQKESCLGIGFAEYDASGNPPFKDIDSGYKFTIGSEQFHKLNNDRWKIYDMWTTEYDDGVPVITVSAFPIAIDDRVMRGWFHVVVNSNKIILALAINGVIDNNYNTEHVGEFVSDFPECTDPDHSQNLPSEGFLPCGAISTTESKIPWGYLYVDDPTGGSKIVPKGDMREFHFNFRISTYYCNHRKDLKFLAIAHLSDWDEPVKAYSDKIIFNNNKVIGASDPIPRPNTYDKITCHKTIDQLNLGKPDYLDEIMKQQTVYTTYTSCTTLIRDTYLDKIEKNNELFAGRCDNNNENPEDKFNTCDINDDLKGSGRNYEEFYEEVQKRSADCPEPDKYDPPCPTVGPRPSTTLPTTTTTTTVKTTTTTTKATTTAKTTIPPTRTPPTDKPSIKKGLSMQTVPSLEIWDSRVVHGISMSIVTFFVSPVNMFLTRYYKETFMGTRVLYLRVWYCFHHSSIGISFVLYLAGIFRMITRRTIAGVSLSPMGKIHQYLGWSSISVVICLSFLGGFRSKNRVGRGFCIFWHWALGTCVHVSNYVQVIISLKIPGSPSAYNDASIVSKMDWKHEVVLELAVFWIAIDIIMHICMQVYMCVIDQRMRLTRSRYYFPSLMPVLTEHATCDVPGSLFRKIILGVYCVNSFAFTAAISYLLLNHDDAQVKKRGLGQMSCTHNTYATGFLTKLNCN